MARVLLLSLSGCNFATKLSLSPRRSNAQDAASLPRHPCRRRTSDSVAVPDISLEEHCVTLHGGLAHLQGTETSKYLAQTRSRSAMSSVDVLDESPRARCSPASSRTLRRSDLLFAPDSASRVQRASASRVPSCGSSLDSSVALAWRAASSRRCSSFSSPTRRCSR